MRSSPQKKKKKKKKGMRSRLQRKKKKKKGMGWSPQKKKKKGMRLEIRKITCNGIRVMSWLRHASSVLLVFNFLRIKPVIN